MSDGGFIFEKTEGGYVVTGLEEPAEEDLVTPAEKDLVIPAEHDGEPVVGIGRHAFIFQEEIRSIFIPETVESIGEGAFYHCIGLREVSGMGGVRRIDASIFSRCQDLTRMTIPACCVEVDPDAFSDCSRLAEVKNLSALDIRPGEPGHPGREGLFYGCNVCRDESGAGTFFTTEDGFSWYRYTDSGGTERRFLTGYEGEERDLVLPGDCDGLPYDVFGGAFECGCIGMESVTIPPCVRYIGAYAFFPFAFEVRVRSLSDWLNIKFESWSANPLFGGGFLSVDGKPAGNFTLPIGTKEIPDFAFAGAGYSCVAIPEGVTRIGRGAFEGCESLVSVTLPESLLSVGEDAFDGCFRLVEVVNLSALKIIPGDDEYGCVGVYAKAVKSSAKETGTFTREDGGYMFYDSGDGLYLYAYDGDGGFVTLPETEDRTYEICSFAFNHAPVTEVSVPSCVTSVGGFAFQECDDLRRVSIGDGVTHIDYGAFASCTALEEVQFGRGLLILGDHAFEGCKRLEEIRLPYGIRHIGVGAFLGCESLSSILVAGPVTYIGPEAFRTNGEAGSGRVPDVFLSAYIENIYPDQDEWWMTEDELCLRGDSDDDVEDHITVYSYKAERPEEEGRFWHYDGAGNPVKWL